MRAKLEIAAVVFWKQPLHGRVQPADERQADKTAVSMAAEHKINVPEGICAVENKRVRHVCQTYFRKLRVFKRLQEHIFRRGGKLLLRASKGKAIAHRPADAQRLTGERHIRIAVIDHDCASLRD